ncbi:MAG: cobalamin biosynthesis protein CobQ [Eubacterium sp.]
MDNKKTFKIGWLFPDTLYLHGDRGNILAIEKMAKMSGYDVEITTIDFDTVDFCPTDYDFLFCSPGEIASFPSIIEYLKTYLVGLKAYIQADKPLLVTGTSTAFWGKEILRTDGTKIKGLEIIDITSKENEAVYGDDLYFSCQLDGKPMEIIGNQIQMIDIEIGQEDAFGKLFYGYGNSGKDTNEGVQVKNAVFTNTLAPILVCNPWLTKAFVDVMLKNNELLSDTFNPEMTLEQKSFDSKKQFIHDKETHLTNCPKF